MAQVAASIVEFGWTNPILAGADGVIIAGHARLLAARKLGMAEVPVIVLDHLSRTQRRALVIADNKLALNADWNMDALKVEMDSLREEAFAIELVGFSADELGDLLGAETPPGIDREEDVVPDPPAQPVTRPGDVWLIGKHRLICGDCRDQAVVQKLMAGASANVAITSPPYATQREYDPSSGFKPVPPAQYSDWFRAVAAGVESVLAPDGSYFLNIKAHADDGERNLYVMDLVLAHRRQWGWRFVDEFCWRKTDNGVPGGWGNRFKNAWEPIFHFCRQQSIKFRPMEVGHASDDCFDYSPNNPKSNSGSGLLGTSPRGHEGVARPSNVIEVKSETGQGTHSAPFPRALVEFFLKAFSDPGDSVFDPFMGSGTTMAAAALLNRTGYGCEISPAYCDVIVRRVMNLTGDIPILSSTGETFAAVAESRKTQEPANPGWAGGPGGSN